MSEESEKDRFQEMEHFFYPGQVRILRERMPDGSLRRIESDEIVHVLNSLNKCLRDSQEAWRELARKNQELRKCVIDLETAQEKRDRHDAGPFATCGLCRRFTIDSNETFLEWLDNRIRNAGVEDGST